MALEINDIGRTIQITGTTAASEKVTDDHCYISKIVWYNATSAADKLNITDKDGNDIFPFVAAGSNRMVSYDFMVCPHPIDGIYIDDLDSGEVYIYIATRPGAM